MVAATRTTVVTMPTSTQRTARLAVLKLLSETELERVNDRDAVRKLAAGEEYLDLEFPLSGAQRSTEGPFPKGRILTRSTVDGQTWQRILSLVSPTPPDSRADTFSGRAQRGNDSSED